MMYKGRPLQVFDSLKDLVKLETLYPPLYCPQCVLVMNLIFESFPFPGRNMLEGVNY